MNYLSWTVGRRVLRRIDRPGLASQTHDGIVLLLGQSLALDVTMRLSTFEQGITVGADTVVEAGHTAVATVVRREQVENLPINGRNFSELQRDDARGDDGPHAPAGRHGD